MQMVRVKVRGIRMVKARGRKNPVKDKETRRARGSKTAQRSLAKRMGRIRAKPIRKKRIQRTRKERVRRVPKKVKASYAKS